MFEVVRQVNAFVAHLLDEEVGERPHERVDASASDPADHIVQHDAEKRQQDQHGKYPSTSRLKFSVVIR
jgi:hypothetical protein